MFKLPPTYWSRAASIWPRRRGIWSVGIRAAVSSVVPTRLKKVSRCRSRACRRCQVVERRHLLQQRSQAVDQDVFGSRAGTHWPLRRCHPPYRITGIGQPNNMTRNALVQAFHSRSIPFHFHSPPPVAVQIPSRWSWAGTAADGTDAVAHQHEVGGVDRHAAPLTGCTALMPRRHAALSIVSSFGLALTTARLHSSMKAARSPVVSAAARWANGCSAATAT